MKRKQNRSRVKDGFGFAETKRTLPIALLRARESVMEHFRPMLNSHDITEQQWRTIRVLQEAGETDAAKLAERACILPPSLTRILKSLEARGFVSLRKDVKDGRRTLIELTSDGARFIHDAAPESVAIYKRIEDQLGSERIEILLDELNFLLSQMDKRPPSVK